uniref:F-box/kelch-repeat protein n=1 Tax=Noccaea caerulescens TaxID=107243 RepID=A0A1J3H0F9_NOCCA
MEKHSLPRYSYCVIENVWYSASYGDLRWYDYEVHEWKNLNGLDGLPLRKLGPFDRIGLAGYGGGKMMVFWKEEMPSGFFGSVRYHTKIWCAEISLERRSEGIWGKVEWFDPVLTSPMNFNFIKVLAPTL